MELSFLQSILYSLVAGLADILPISAEAHKVLLFKIYGVKVENTATLDLLIHLGVLAGLYFSNLSHLTRISKARSLAKVPKRRRRRPLDTRSLMDFSMLKTMSIPVVIGLLLYSKVSHLVNNLMLLAAFLLVNGIILYIPQFLPGSNRDARTLSPIAGFAIGMGGGFSILPGISAVGTTTAIASVCGVDRSYGLDMALLMEMVIIVGYIIYDIMAIASVGLGSLPFLMLIRFLLCAVLAFAACVLAVKLLRSLAASQGFSMFGFYNLGLSLFAFILNLMA